MRLIDADEIRIKPEYMHDICGSVMIRVEDVARIITEMPTINPQPHWTPCSERLPELDDVVLVTDDYDRIRHCVFCKRGKTWRGFVTYEEGITIDAIAWQPLPSPYQEEGEEE